MTSQSYLLWHYTHGFSMPGLMESGMILLTGHNYDMPEAERAVWFSKNQSWENTVKKHHSICGHLMTFVELVEELGAYRIGIAPADAPIAFQQLAQLRPEIDWRALARLGREWGANPREWFVSFEPVPREKWQAVQVYRQGGWVDLTEAELRKFAEAAAGVQRRAA